MGTTTTQILPKPYESDYKVMRRNMLDYHEDCNNSKLNKHQFIKNDFVFARPPSSSSSSSTVLRRHLLPRPASTFSRNNNHPSYLRKDGEEEGIITADPLVSSRWNPTQEQLKALQEMYERGVRTPSAEEIQIIASKLRRFGKIEGKNVFYWFQNHKARERLKRRRQPASLSEKNIRYNNIDHETLRTKEGGLCCYGKYLDSEQNKKFITTSNCSLSPMEGSSLSMRRQTAEAAKESSGGNPLMEMELSSMTTPHINNASSLISEESAGNKMKFSSINFKIFSSNYENKLDEMELIQNCSSWENNYQILKLFPIRDYDDEDHSTQEAFRRIDKAGSEEEVSKRSSNSNFTPNQFYVFL